MALSTATHHQHDLFWCGPLDIGHKCNLACDLKCLWEAVRYFTCKNTTGKFCDFFFFRSHAGRVGVAVVTAGPGLTNTVTAVKNAQMAESPLLLMGGAAATLLQVKHKGINNSF